MKQKNSNTYDLDAIKSKLVIAGYSSMLGVLGQRDIPVKFNTSMTEFGRYSFTKVSDGSGAKPVIKDRVIELNPAKHKNDVDLASTFAHELKHAEDIDGEYPDAKESDRPELEARAEKVQGEFMRKCLSVARENVGMAY
jgi:hypothetical protein